MMTTPKPTHSQAQLLEKIDNMIHELSKIHVWKKWQIRLQSNLAEELFGLPIPEEYKGNRIVVDDDLKETIIADGFSSDIQVVPDD